MTIKSMMKLTNFDDSPIWVDVRQINAMWIDPTETITCFTLIGDPEPFKVKTALTDILKNIPDRLDPNQYYFTLSPTERGEEKIYDNAKGGI